MSTAAQDEAYARRLREQQDAEYARQLAQREERALQRQQSSSSQARIAAANRQYLPAAYAPTDEMLARPRCWVIGLALLDLVSLFVLMLQLTPPGMPHSFDELAAHMTPQLLQDFWFAPSVVAASFPLLGGLVGAGCFHRWACWVYVAFLSVCVGFRAFLLFEMSSFESWPGPHTVPLPTPCTPPTRRTADLRCAVCCTGRSTSPRSARRARGSSSTCPSPASRCSYR